MFTNLFRDMDNHKGIGKRRFQGWVVNNDDSKDEDKNKRQLQRIKVRIHDLHDNVKDEDLPWLLPGNLPSYSGGANVGDHGPVPPNGSKVWVEFEGDTQYHGVYTGAVQAKTNKISDFTNKGKYAKNYPAASGGVDQSGSLTAKDHVKDTSEETHVAGTTTQTDGKGNVMSVVNGDAERKDNPKAEKQFPKGFSTVIFGNLNIHVQGDINASCSGKANVTAGADANVSAKQKVNVIAGADVTVNSKGKTDVVAQGEVHVSSQDTVNVSAKKKIALDAPSITSSVVIVVSAGKKPGTPGEPGKVIKADPPKPRTRPDLQAKDTQKTNQTQDGKMTDAQREEAERDPTTTKAALAAIDDVAKNDLMAQAQAELMNDPGKDSVTKKVKLAGADTDYEYTVRRA